MKQSYASAGKAPRRRVHSLSGIAAIAECGLPPPRIVIGYQAHQAQSAAEPCLTFLILECCPRRLGALPAEAYDCFMVGTPYGVQPNTSVVRAIDRGQWQAPLGSSSRPTARSPAACRRARVRQGQAFGGAEEAPSLTAAARDGDENMRVGRKNACSAGRTKEWNDNGRQKWCEVALTKKAPYKLAWRFLMFQKDSALARWYRTRTEGPSGARKTTMIVALARKLLIALWRLVTTGEVPDGVELRPAM